MPDTPEHRADMTALARRLAAQGKPQWSREVALTDLWERREEEHLGHAEYVRLVAARVRASGWARATDRSTDLDGLLAAMAACQDDTEAPHLYDQLYDLADYDRVWLNRFDYKTKGGA